MTPEFLQILSNTPILVGIIGLFLGLCIGLAIIALNTRRHNIRIREVEQQMYQAKEAAAVAHHQIELLEKSAEEREKLLKESRLKMGQEFELLANRIFETKQKQFDQQQTKNLSQTLEPLKTQLNQFSQQVRDSYQKESDNRNQLIGKINELQQQTQKIGEDAVNLALALKGDNKAQGNWGEVVLERLLEESGLQKGREYDTQISLNDEEGKRRQPDVIIFLPENKQLVIDAKVSLLAYESYTQCESEEEQSAFLKQHVDSVRQHIKGLSRKNYENLEGIQTLDFVFIFMPIEAAFMLALQHDPALFKEAYDKQIVLVSPTTLMATLRTVANLWRYHKQHKNAEEIADRAGRLYDQLALVVESLDKLGVQLEKTQDVYNKARNQLSGGRGNLIWQVEQLKQLGAKAKKSLPANASTSLLPSSQKENEKESEEKSGKKSGEVEE